MEPCFERSMVTTGLLAFSSFLQSYGLFLAAGLVGLFFFLQRYFRTTEGRRELDRCSLGDG